MRKFLINPADLLGKSFKVPAFWLPGKKVEFGRPVVLPKIWGRVVWVHPRLRFAVLEYAGGIREAFALDDLGVVKYE